MKIFISLLFLSLIFQATFAKDKYQWASRRIYQVITDRFALGNETKPYCDIPKNGYCGGNFKGIQNNLDYIQDLGFDAIWISPIPKNYRQDYHGYAAMNIYEINEHFGTEEDFKNLITAMKQRGMWLMLDVVANHMGNLDTDPSKNVPFNKKEYFHDYCDITDHCFAVKDMNCIRNCRLASLADLKQEHPFVETTLLNWIHDLVAKFQIEGIRIDTVPEVPKWFWEKFNIAANVYTIGEVYDGNIGYNAQFVGPLDAVLNYPYFYKFRDLFINQRSMYEIREFNQEWKSQLSVQEINFLGLFTDNHDQPRFLSNEVCTAHRSWEYCVTVYKSFQTMTLTSVGIPILYYGTEQLFHGGHDPYDREPMWNSFNRTTPFYKYIKAINQVRKDYKIHAYQQTEAYADYSFYAYFRGQVLVCLTNVIDRTIQKTISYHPFQAGEKLCNVLKDNDCVTVGQNKHIIVKLFKGEAKVYVPQKAQQQHLRRENVD